MHKVKVLIAEHHELIRQKLKAILRTEHTVSVVGEATTGGEVMEKTEKLNPDVVILDLVNARFRPCRLDSAHTCRPPGNPRFDFESVRL
jgi:DNA-binding NarL/FixJ family response regulator